MGRTEMQQCWIALVLGNVEEGKMAQDGFTGKLLCCGMARAQPVCRDCCNPQSEIPLVCWPAGILLHVQEDEWGRGHKQVESSMFP